MAVYSAIVILHIYKKIKGFCYNPHSRYGTTLRSEIFSDRFCPFLCDKPLQLLLQRKGIKIHKAIENLLPFSAQLEIKINNSVLDPSANLKSIHSSESR